MMLFGEIEHSAGWIAGVRQLNLVVHYVNSRMQFTTNFNSRQNDNVQMQKSVIFCLIFAQNI